MKIFYFIRNSLHMYPPCLSQILYLNDLGQEVIVCFGDCDSSVKAILDERGIEYIDFNIQRGKNKYIGKIQSFYLYKKNVRKIIDLRFNQQDILWFGTADSVFFLEKYLQSKKYVLSILELYDDNNFYRKQISKYITKAEIVISCEETRSRIMKSWWGLKDSPVVIPNKPYEHPRQRNIKGSTKETQELIERIKDKKIILYQGIISVDRDLKKLAQTLRKMKSEYYLVLMGKEFFDSVSEIKKIYNNTIYLGFVPAPLHLEITSYANIGIANYDDSSLNNLFCAPNKIYEYSGFKIPTLGSDVIGLTDTVGKYEAGVCCDFKDVESLEKGLKKIIESESFYANNAEIFFDSTNNLIKMKKIIERLERTSK